MHWVVQNGFDNDPSVREFKENLKRMNIPHTLVDMVPFSEEIYPELSQEVDISKVVVYGTISLANIAKLKNWKPGSFKNENFNMKSVLKNWGDMCLSYKGARFGTIDSFNALNLPSQFFIRPDADSKAFSGQVMTSDDFLLWRSNVVQWCSDNSQVNPKTEVMIAPVQEIQAEYRFFVVDKRVITGSQYQLGGELVKKPYNEIEDFVKTFAYACVAPISIDCWNPDRAFALDIAVNADGDPKVLEIGCLNSCGFYACDTQKLIDAIQGMRF